MSALTRGSPCWAWALALLCVVAAGRADRASGQRGRQERYVLHVAADGGSTVRRFVWQAPGRARAEIIDTISTGAFIHDWFHGAGRYRIGYAGTGPEDTWTDTLRLTGREIEGRVHLDQGGRWASFVLVSSPRGLRLRRSTSPSGYSITNEGDHSVTLRVGSDGAWAEAHLEVFRLGDWSCAADCPGDPRVEDGVLAAGATLPLGPPELIETLSWATGRVRRRLAVEVDVEHADYAHGVVFREGRVTIPVAP